MAEEQNLINQLLDAIERLLIENRVYKSALRAIDSQLPPQARQLAEKMIAGLTADRKFREDVHRTFVQCRDQSLESTVQSLVKHLKDVN